MKKRIVPVTGNKESGFDLYINGQKAGKIRIIKANYGIPIYQIVEILIFNESDKGKGYGTELINAAKHNYSKLMLFPISYSKVINFYQKNEFSLVYSSKKEAVEIKLVDRKSDEIYWNGFPVIRSKEEDALDMSFPYMIWNS